ncbi:transcriptional regulator [Tersicoccus solisilvae]|uniref:Transcriptional regulator n=1 Tax=Tersicoccus solisilvae TaxID=1882339 RepID=A0ABQ1P3P3_9MICC|nr:LuxR family transcriptional regulator [Tersicoccus solisilvae]GGC86192.1 transcriptional regulator [Tersicoccus solisilvae]
MTSPGTSTPAVTLVGRATELARLQRLVNDARRGRPCAAVLRGAPGVGKTALLEQLERTCPDFRVLWVRTSSRLSGMPLAALSMLVEPLTGYLDRLSAPRRAAVEGALALGPPVRGEIALATGVTDLLRIASRDHPLLILMDDAQHLDDGSLKVFTFVANHLQHDRVAAFVAIPDGATLETEYEQIRLDGLTEDEARAMLSGYGVAVPHDVLAELVRATAGNPLAILESARSEEITDFVLSDHARVPSAAAVRLVRAYSRRFSDLSPLQRRAAVLIACEQRSTVEILAGALRADDGTPPDPTGADTTLARRAVDALLARDAVRTSGQGVDVRHPLVRQAILAMADPEELRDARTALAAALAAQGWPDAALWQRVAAAAGPDAELSAALAAHARECAGRQDRARASQSYERAADLATDRHTRALLLLEAALNATHVSTRAGDLLQEAMREADTDALREEIALYRALIHSWDGQEPPHPGPVPGVLAPLHAAVRAQLLVVELRADEVPEDAARLARLPSALAGHPVAALVPVAHAMLGYLAGTLDGADVDRVRASAPAHEDVQYSLAAGLLLLLVQDLGGARAALAHGREMAERTGGLAALPWLQACEAWIDVETGDLTAGLRRAVEAAETAPIYSGRLSHALATLVRARALVHGGTPFDDAVGTLPWGEPPAMVRVLLDQLRAADLVSRGRAGDAVKVLDTLLRAVRGLGVRGSLPLSIATDLAEAMLGAGRLTGAQRTAAAVLEELGDGPAPFPLAAVLRSRCRVIAAPREQLDAVVADVLDGGPGLANPWVNAFLTHLVACRYAVGGLRPAATAELVRWYAATAADAFERIPSPHWCELAAGLRDRAAAAAGGADPHDRLRLTDRERQIADEVLTGASTAAMAERLHLSEKTVEGNLTRIYRKAQVRSRAELMARLQGAPAAGEGD